MKAARSEASTVALRGAVGRNSVGKAVLQALAGMKAGRGKIEAVRLAAKAVEIKRAVESGAGLTVAKQGSAASLAKRCSHCPKSI